MPSGKMMSGGAEYPIDDLVIEEHPLVAGAAVACSEFTITQAVEPAVAWIASERARALSAWVKRSRFDHQQFIFGTTPDCSMVRVARVVGVGTAACWADMAPELAEIECVVDYLLTRMGAEELSQVDEQRRLEWPISDGWGIVLQAMVGNQNVQHFGVPAKPVRVFEITAPPTSPNMIRRTLDLSLDNLRAGGLDWAEERFTKESIPFNLLERIPPTGTPRTLDVEQARQAIERADEAFDLS